MSNFRLTIEVPRAEWDAMSDERKQALQRIVDETCDPPKRYRNDGSVLTGEYTPDGKPIFITYTDLYGE